MGNIVNTEAASEFLKTIDDPIVAGLVGYFYQCMLVSEHRPKGDFDLLYCYQILEEYLRDRDLFARVVSGEYKNITGWGE